MSASGASRALAESPQRGAHAADHRHANRRVGVSDPRQPAQFGHHIVLELNLLLGPCVARGERDAELAEPLGLEAERHARQVADRLHEQTGGDNQHEGQRHLRDHQS